MKINKYNKDSNYSFIFGAFGTIELLKMKKEKVIAIIVDPSFIDNDAFKLIQKLISKDKIIIDKKIIDRLKDKGNIFVIGVFEKYKMVIQTSKHLLLDGNFNEGTIGTIIRSMNGFEMKDLVLINNNIDIFSYHLIRSTMGSFFNVNVVKYNSLNEYEKDYPFNQIYCISNVGKAIEKYQLKDNYSLLFQEKNTNNNFEKIKIDKDIPLENIANIVLYCLYK